MKSAGNEGIVHDRLQMFHIHVILVAPLGTATWRSLAQTSIRAEFPSGNVPTMRVRGRISRFSRSIMLFVRLANHPEECRVLRCEVSADRPGHALLEAEGGRDAEQAFAFVLLGLLQLERQHPELIRVEAENYFPEK